MLHGTLSPKLPSADATLCSPRLLTQIVVATAGRSDAEGLVDVYLLSMTKLTAATSFLIAVCMMYSFRSMVSSQIASFESTNAIVAHDKLEEERLLSEVDSASTALRETAARRSSHDSAEAGGSKHKTNRNVLAAAAAKAKVSEKQAHKHIVGMEHEKMAQPLLLRAKAWNGLQQILWLIMAMAIMLVGVGVKLAIYRPDAAPDAHYALASRMLVGVPMAVTFGIQLFYTMVIKNRERFCRFRRLCRLLAASASGCTSPLLALLSLSWCSAPATPRPSPGIPSSDMPI